MVTQVIRKQDGTLKLGNFCVFNSKNKQFSCEGASDALRYSFLFSNDITQEHMMLWQEESEVIINGESLATDEQPPPYIAVTFDSEGQHPEIPDGWYSSFAQGDVIVFMSMKNHGQDTITIELKIPDSLTDVVKLVTPDNDENTSIVKTKNSVKACVLSSPALA